MGNTTSEILNEPLAFMAVAGQLRVQRTQIVVLREVLATMVNSAGYVSKQKFKRALNKAKIKNPQDLEIFELLFTMWDHPGQERIPAKPFCVGISPLACPGDDLLSVLRFSLHVSDDENHGKIGPQELHDMLCAIDMTASYFGDEKLEPKEIDSVVETVFDRINTEIPHELCARKLRSNAYIKRFVSGKRRSRVQFKKELAVVTEFAGALRRDCASPGTSSVSDQLDKHRNWRARSPSPHPHMAPKRSVSLIDDSSDDDDSVTEASDPTAISPSFSDLSDSSLSTHSSVVSTPDALRDLIFFSQ